MGISDENRSARRAGQIGLRDVDAANEPELVVEEIGEGTGAVPKGSLYEDLIPASEAAGLRSRWRDLQTRFVDEPRRSVEEADALVAEVMRLLTERFSEERGRLELQWTRGEHVSTEDLRVALQRYRDFFGRLLEA